MLRAEVEQVKQMASEIAKRAVKNQSDEVLKKIDELASRLDSLEKLTKPAAKPKGKKDAKL